MGEASGLNPKFPVVEGHHRLTAKWSIDLPGKFNRRVEDGDLVLWRPGMTLFVAVWNNDKGESLAARYAWIYEEMNPASFDIVEDDLGDCRRFAYRLREESDDARVPALYGFTVTEDSHVQLAVYFDVEADAPVALQLWRSVGFDEK